MNDPSDLYTNDAGERPVLPGTDSRPIAWVTGAGGLIGSYLCDPRPPAQPAWRVVGLRREQLDLTDFEAVERASLRDRPQLIIHCAAISRSPVCQAQPDLAQRVNVDATGHLVRVAKDAFFVFLSTDLVFDGRKGEYIEEDAVNPLSIYAETKVRAEEKVRSAPRHLILRTSLNFGRSPTADRAFNEELIAAWRSGRVPRLFTDEFRCPIAASVTARAIWELVNRGATGVLHLAGSERLSRWQIGALVAEFYRTHGNEVSPPIEQAVIQLVPDSLLNYSGAPRPPDVSLNCSRATHILGRQLPGFSDWLHRQTIASI